MTCTTRDGAFDAGRVVVDEGGVSEASKLNSVAKGSGFSSNLAPPPSENTPAALPPCPCLPPSRADIDWRWLHALRGGDRGAAFYLACLEYAQVQWHRRLPSRAVLCLDRAFGAALQGDEPVLQAWPWPYAAMAWILRHTPAELFVGNPRVHFQHYADRMNEPRRDQRAARAWACWALTRALRPELPGDPRHRVKEPGLADIQGALQRHGCPGEADLWAQVLREVSSPEGVPAAQPPAP